MNFSELPSLKQWVIKNKYYLKVSELKKTNETPTHYLLDGGIWKVPLHEYENFLRLLASDLQSGQKYYISENKTEIFRFICDLDFYEDAPVTLNQVNVLVKQIQKIVADYYPSEYNNVIICGTSSKEATINGEHKVKSGFHLVWNKLYVNKINAILLRNKIVSHLNENYNDPDEIYDWENIIDSCIYSQNGLRMIGSRKISVCSECKNKRHVSQCVKCGGLGKIDQGRVYSAVNIIRGDFTYDTELLSKITKDFFLCLLETSIINYHYLPESNLIKELPLSIIVDHHRVKKEMCTNSNDKKKVKADDLLEKRVENFTRKNFPKCYSSLVVKKITKVNEGLYWVEPRSNFCMNVNREHNSSGIYFQIKRSGITQRCFCKKVGVENTLCDCKDYFSKEVKLSKILENILFGKSSVREITKYNISTGKNNDTHMKNSRQFLENLENELISLKNLNNTK